MFRIYDQEFETYVSRGEYTREEGVLIDEKGNCFEIVEGRVVNSPDYLTVERGVGIVDKNNIPVYENDIVDFLVGVDVTRLKIEFDKGMFYMKNKEIMIPIRFDLFFELEADDSLSKHIIVVGKYKDYNKEMLEKYNIE